MSNSALAEDGIEILDADPPSPTSDVTIAGRPTRLDWSVAIVVAAAAGLVILLTSNRLWFFSDTWPIVADRWLRTADGWTKPHGGHWLVGPTVAAKISLRLSEDNFYPGYFLPRVILHSGLSLAWWRVLRWRGVPQLPAITSLLLIAWLGTSGWMITVVYIGPIIVGLCALGSAWILDQGDASASRQVWLFVMAALAVASSADGPALWASLFVVALLTRQLRAFAVPIGASGALYAWWYLTIARFDPNPLTPTFPGLDDFIGAPLDMTELIGTGIGAPFRLGPDWRYVVAGLFYIVVVVLWRKGRLRRFDAVILLTGVVIVALSVLVRGSQGAQVAAPNRVYLVSAYLLVGLLPALLAGLRKAPALGAAVAIGLLALPNLAMTIDEINTREDFIEVHRAQAETAIALIDDGSAYIPWAGVTLQAPNRFLQTLVFRGWEGEIHPELRESIQGQMMLALDPRVEPRGWPLVTAEDFNSATGCIDLEGDRAYTFALTGDGTFTIGGAADDTVSFVRAGEASFTRELIMGREVQGLTYAATPENASNTLTITGAWNPTETRALCGVAAVTN